MNRMLIPLYVIILFSVFSCKTLEKNIAAAELAVKQANEIGAKTYAQEDIKNAEDQLKAAKEKRESDKKAANQNALDSRTNADLAYFKTVNEMPPRETGLTEESRGQATNHNAQVLAKEKFDAAEKEFEEAKALMKKIEDLSKEIKELEKEIENEKK